KQRRARPIRIPKVMVAHRQYAARDVEPAMAQRPALCAIQFEELATVVRRLDLAQLAPRDVGIKDIQPIVVGKEQRGMAARPCRWECAAAATTICRGRRQIPEG